MRSGAHKDKLVWTVWFPHTSSDTEREINDSKQTLDERDLHLITLDERRRDTDSTLSCANSKHKLYLAGLWPRAYRQSVPTPVLQPSAPALPAPSNLLPRRLRSRAHTRLDPPCNLLVCSFLPRSEGDSAGPLGKRPLTITTG